MQLSNFIHPGFEFIESYASGLPDTRRALAKCVRDYVEYLLRESRQTGDPPVEIEPIFERFHLKHGAETLRDTLPDVQGFASSDLGLILSSDDDPLTRQRFTHAHELLEFLVSALQGNQYRSHVGSYLKGQKKERLCNWGAGRLLMPLQSFSERLSHHGLSIQTTKKLATEYRTSPLATLYHIVNSFPRNCGLIIWRHDWKPSELGAVASDNQTALFESHYRHAPPKQLRVWWSVFGPQAKKLQPPRHKSIHHDSLLCRAFEEGTVQSGRERLELVHLSGEFFIEATPFRFGTELCVLSLIHWPKEFFDRQGVLIP